PVDISRWSLAVVSCFFFQAEDGIRDATVTGVQTCALPIFVAAKDKTGVVTSYTIDPDGAGPAQPFTLDNPDFSQQSLRGNAVFRSEERRVGKECRSLWGA